MHRTTGTASLATANLTQHFQNYFDLLVGVERQKLLRAIDSTVTSAEHSELLVEIEHRIHYLRGAVRMGALLCLINQEEAKAHLGQLAAERDRLITSAMRRIDRIEPMSKADNGSQ